MEIQVDVHTVHPASSSPSAKRSTKSACMKRAYGSWCTPDATPIHEALSHTNSNIETTSQIKDDPQTHNKESILQLQKLRLFSADPPPDYESTCDLKEVLTELDDLKTTKSHEDSITRFTPECESPPPQVQAESPQSPVPSSRSSVKKCKWFKLPTFCDPFVPIDPHGRVYISWLFLVTFCYSYNAWCITLRATFPYQTPDNTPIWMTVDYFCDLVYLMDVALVKPRLMFLHEGFWADDIGETRRNYTKKMQFKFDVVSLLPLDLLYIYFGTQKVILRLPRLLKLQTFWEFHQAMDSVLKSPYVVRIGKMLFYIFYLIHLNACAYYAVSDFIGLGTTGWVYDNKGNAYIRCFYFATKTATSIGKNPKPENLEEYLFMTIAWLMGVFVFALLIGQIRDIFATATRARTEYRKHMDGTTQYMRRLNLPAALQRRVTSWFIYTWRQQRCFDEANILNSLPSNMKRDVSLAVHMSTLSKVQLFQDCSDSLLRDLVLQLKPVSFLPGDVVVRRGDVGHQMYIIKSGECCVMSQNDSDVVAFLKEGSVFGEISLLGIEGLRRRTATVRSRGYSNLFALSRHDLEAALQHHKEAARVLRLRADQIIRENAARQCDQHAAERRAQSAAERHLGGDAARGSQDASAGPSAERRCRSAAALSRRRRSAASDLRPQTVRASLGSANSSVRTQAPAPVPTIVLSSDND